MAYISGNVETTVDTTNAGGSADAFIPDLWSLESMSAAEFAAVIAKRVDRHYEAQLKFGDVLHVPTISNLTANNKAIGNDVSFESMVQPKESIHVNLHKYAAFLLEDLVEIQTNTDLRPKYTKKIGYALQRAVETTLSGMFDGFTNNVGTLGVELTTDDYLTAWQNLAEAGLLENSPDPSADFSIILSPAAYAAAMKIEMLTNRDYNPGADAVQRMRVGNIFGFEVFVSNLLESDSAGQHDCIMMAKEAIALIMSQDVKIESDHLIEKMGDAVVGSVVYGAAEMNWTTETAASITQTDNRGCYLKTV